MQILRERMMATGGLTVALAVVLVQQYFPDLIDDGGIFKGSLFGPGTSPDPGCATSPVWWRPIDTSAKLEVGPALTSDYYMTLADKVSTFGEPIVVDNTPATEEEITRIRQLVFTEIRTTDEVVPGVTADGSACSSRQPLASVSVEDGELIAKEYPGIGGLSPDKQLWLRAHELGHGIDAVVGAVEDFNQLSEAERVEILTELQRLREALAAKGYTVSYTSGKELFANLYAALLLEPDMAADLAPKSSAFLGGLINQDPELGRALIVR